ncbi:DUF6223 family protein [Nocardia sp. NPDC004604]|uniref:DUF6223 family protein n=1 Tax=Nocardia sp. NPDC004604 TaxID=3157013 RepID=UPI0033BDABF5
MSIPFRRAAAATLLAGLSLATPAVAHASVQPAAASVYTLSAGRIGASTAALIGLVGAIIGGLTLARADRIGNRAKAAITALAAGLISLALGVLVAATAKGGIGTGNGLGGAYVALVVGLISTVLGALALFRSRRTG